MCYRNTFDSTFFAKARLNALKLEDQVGRGKSWYDKTCKLCRQAKEDMVHFIIDCPALEVDRNYDLIKTSSNSSQEKMIDLLFNTDKFLDTGCMIRKMWHRRRKMLAYMKKMQEKNIPSNVINKNKPLSQLVLLKSDPGPVREGPANPIVRSL